VLDVSFYGGFIYAHCAYIVAHRPYATAPMVTFLQKFELLIQPFAGIGLYHVYHFGNTELWWKTYNYMNMVGLYVSFNILNFRVIFSNLIHLDEQIFFDSVYEHLISVTGYPYDMVLTSVRTVGLSPGFHLYILP